MSDTQIIDMHTHSTASDGSDTPSELVRKAAALSLSAIALTDHDTVSGLSEFMAAGRQNGIRTIPGVELSSQMYDKEVHLVGLFIDPENQAFRNALAQLRLGRERRNRQMIEKIRARGYDLTEDDVMAVAKGESVGRPHIAAALMQKGYFKDMRDIFQTLLRRGAPCYVQRTFLCPTAAIEAIHAAGGIAIWAHPLNAPRLGRSFLKKIYHTMLPANLDGIETRYSTYTPMQQNTATLFAEEFGLLQSGGSDYHGTNQPSIALGTGSGDLRVPLAFLDAMDQKRRTGL